ncbi:MAG: putative hemolysin [Saprospiraceae bacterium]|jgi:putative hemolysin
MTYIFIIILMVVFSAFFSGLEIAFVSSDKMLIEMNKKKSGKTVYKILSEFSNKPSRFLATLLIGNNLTIVLYGIFMDKVLKAEISTWIQNGFMILLIQTVVSTAIILIFAEYLPKALFRLKPNKILAFFSFPMYAMYWLMKGIVWVFVGISKFILKVFFKLEIEESPTIFGRIELEQYLENRTLDADESALDSEIQIYKNVLEFSNVKVRECMVPRTEIIGLDVNIPIDTLINTFVNTGLSKILIFKDSIDEIIGFVHHSEMFKNPKRIKNVLLPVGFIPTSMSAQETLNSFMRQQKSILVVVDEFGGTAGMVTVEDVMEEIFGEIEDEHDIQEHTEEKLSEGTYLFSGRLEIDYINNKYNLKIPVSEEYETIAGYLFTHFGSIPNAQEKMTTDKYNFTIESVSETRIELVQVDHLPTD